MQQLMQYLKNKNKHFYFWIRCDDIGFYTERTVRFDSLIKKYNIPTIYAVIPTQLTEQTTELIKNNKYAVVSQHGYNHNNNSKTSKCELVYDEKLYENVLKEKKNLQQIFGKQFVNIITPPYYNIHKKMSEKLSQHFDTISLFLNKSATFLKWFNPNVELVDWSAKNEFAGEDFVNKQIKKCSKNYNHIGLCVHCETLNEDAFTYLENLFKFVNLCDFITPSLNLLD